MTIMKLIKKLFCRLGWHSYFIGYTQLGQDSYGKYQCKWCGFIGLKDSQGNLF